MVPRLKNGAHPSPAVELLDCRVRPGGRQCSPWGSLRAPGGHSPGGVPSLCMTPTSTDTESAITPEYEAWHRAQEAVSEAQQIGGVHCPACHQESRARPQDDDYECENSRCRVLIFSDY